METSDELTGIFIAVGGLQDGADEVLSFGATVVAANGTSGSQADILVGGVRGNVTYFAGVFTIQKYNFTALTASEAQAIIGDILYENLAALVTTGDRTFTFTTEDDTGNTSIGAIATVSVAVDPADAAESTLTPTSASISVGGSTQVLTVTAKNGGGASLPAGGETVVISRLSGTGMVGPVTDNLDGTYSATVTSPNLIGSGVFVATLDGDPVQSGGVTQTEATVTYTAGPAAGIVLIGPDDVVAGAISDELTLTVVDAYGNPTVAGAETVFSLSSTNGGTATFYSAGSNPLTQLTVGAGESSITFRYRNTLASTHTVTATGASGNPALIAETADHDITADPAAPAQLSLTGPASVAADVAGNFVLTVEDAFGNATNVSADTTFALSSTSTGTTEYNPASPVTVLSGQSTVNFTYKDTQAALQTVTATATAIPADAGLTGDSATHDITVNAGVATLANSIVTADPASIMADGTSTSTITIQLKDAFDNNTALVGGPVTLATDEGELLAALTNNGGGEYTQQLESATAVATATLTASLNGDAVTDTAAVDFVAGIATLANTIVTAGPTSITADGTSTSTITIQLKDAFDNDTELVDGPVTLATDTGVLLATLVDNGGGTYTQQLESGTSVETATLTASLDGDAVTDTATVDFVAGVATLANTTVTADPTSITADGASTSTITIQLKDAFGNDTTLAGGPVTLNT
ncbi:MAG: invasin domain 3-containing protein, partial [Phycisphaeraceae bacterium]